ncbi:MAG: efflux RND transporter periplasmic adaptor subunit [Planctomycetota bacterium]
MYRYLIFATVLSWTPLTNAQTPVRVAQVRLEHLQQRQAVTGSLRAVARGELAALESGRLMTLAVREGDVVKQGDVIATIDSRRLRAQRSAAEADVRVAEAELKRHAAIAKRAAADLQRGRKLIRRNAVSQQELDSFRAAADVATAEVESAKRQIERANESIRLLDVRLSDTEITAPYDASVVARHVEPGDWVQPGDSLLTLVSSGPIEAWLEVPERFAAHLAGGTAIAIESASTTLPLRVIRTKRVADVNPRVRTIQFIATIENTAGILSPGMSVKGWVPAGKEGDFLTVPKDAIVRRSRQATVFAIDDEQKANPVAVRILFETPHRSVIESDRIQSRDLVVVEGNERLMAGQVVKFDRMHDTDLALNWDRNSIP